MSSHQSSDEAIEELRPQMQAVLTALDTFGDRLEHLASMAHPIGRRWRIVQAVGAARALARRLRAIQ